MGAVPNSDNSNLQPSRLPSRLPRPSAPFPDPPSIVSSPPPPAALPRCAALPAPAPAPPLPGPRLSWKKSSSLSSLPPSPPPLPSPSPTSPRPRPPPPPPSPLSYSKSLSSSPRALATACLPYTKAARSDERSEKMDEVRAAIWAFQREAAPRPARIEIKVSC